MRRAVAVLLLAALLPTTVLADKPQGLVDAVGTLDFEHGPHFKVGDWVRYRTQGQSVQGYKTDYTVTVLIGGEERWWGDDCFWVETQTSYSGQEPEVASSLISYAVFRDSLPTVRYRRYVRKFTDGYDYEGKPIQQVFLRAAGELTQRGWSEPTLYRKRDTLGVDRVEVPKGAFQALKVAQHYQEHLSSQGTDSTDYVELTEEHTYWWSDKVPLTRLVRKDQLNTQRRRAWKIGESASAQLQIVEQTTGSTQLVDFGTGMKALSIPERLQHPLSEQLAPGRKRPPPGGAGKPTGAGG
jgi:hypothetical protein